jgi:hypothetical protein
LILQNYRDRYLKDGEDFPGGCIFITFSVELDDQYPQLAREVSSGFEGLKRMLAGYLAEAQAAGEIKAEVDISRITEMIFSGMIGSSVLYGVDKSSKILDASIDALIDTLHEIRELLD